MSNRKYTLQQVRDVSRSVAPWVVVLCIDPLAQRIVWLLANFTSISPNRVTILWLILIFGAAGFYWQGNQTSMIAAASLFLCAIILDYVDGKLARLKGQTSKLGKSLDFFGGQLGSYACIGALLASFYRETGNQWGIFLGAVFVIYFTAIPVYIYLIRPKLKKRCPGPVWQDNAEPLTPQRMRSRRLTLSPGLTEAVMLLLVVFPIVGMVFQGLIAAVILAFIDFATFIAERAFLLASKKPSG